jgi:hypothetical protein
MQTNGYATAGDGGGVLLKKVGSAPAHEGKVQSLDGAWWEYVAGETANVLSFGASPGGVVDSSTAVNNTIAFAASTSVRPRVRFPAGTYLLNTTITIRSNMIFEGDGVGSSILRPGMTDATGCIKVYSGSSFFAIRDLSIITTMNFANFVTGAASPQNCTAILANDVSLGHTTRWMMENVYIYGCSVGLNMIGWVFTAVKTHIDSCGTGLIGSEFNAINANLHMENNRKSFAIASSYGILFNGLLDEGAVSGSQASTLDSCEGVTFTSPYWEGGVAYPRTEPFLIIGGTSVCKSVDITGGTLSGGSGMAAGISPLKLDRVEVCRVALATQIGAQGRCVETTVNTKSLTLDQHVSIYGAAQDNSKGIGRVINYFANSEFETWFRGWGSIQLTRATFSKEATLVRRGLNALRVSATAGQAFNNMAILLGYGVPAQLAGKTARIGAWVWVPNITEYNEASRTAYPGIAISSYNGSTFVDSSSVTTKMVRNAWNFLTASVAVQSDVTEIYVYLQVNESATNASGNEYLVYDCISIVEDRCSLMDQQNGNYADSMALPLFVNNRMELVYTPSANANLVYEVGDKYWNRTVAAAGTPGKVCTTGGAGGVAVWSNMSPLV